MPPIHATPAAAEPAAMPTIRRLDSEEADDELVVVDTGLAGPVANISPVLVPVAAETSTVVAVGEADDEDDGSVSNVLLLLTTQVELATALSFTSQV